MILLYVRVSIKYLVALLLFAYVHTAAYSQRPVIPDANTVGDTIVKDTLFESAITLDTTIVDFFYLDDIDSIFTFSDTLLDHFHLKRPQEKWGDPGQNLGNHAGSQTSSLVRVREDIFMDLGYDQYRYFEKNRANTPWLHTNRSFANLFFAPYGGIQNNFIVKAKFARNFQNNIHLAIDFDRISIEDVYESQGAIHSAIATHMRYGNPGDKYIAAFSYFGHFNTENHNGGIQDVNQQGLNPLDLLVKLGGASSRYQNISLHFDQWLSYVNKKGLGIKLHHNSQYDSGFYKYTDQNPSNIFSTYDTSFYSTQYLTDFRGLRIYNFERNLGHNLELIFPFSKYGKLLVGVGQRTHWFDLDGLLKIQRNNLWLHGSAQLTPLPLFNADASIKIGSGDAAGTFAFSTHGLFKLRDYLHLHGDFSILRRQVDLNHRMMVLSKELIVDEDWANEVWTQSSIGLRIPKTHTDVTLRNISVSNVVYFNEEQRATQLESAINIQQILVSQDFSLWKIKSQNTAGFQFFSQNIWHKPNWVSQHSLFFESFAFSKALLLQSGFYFRNTVQDQHMGFNGLHGTFYPVLSERLWYPYFDFFANAKIQQFRFFLKFENIYQILQDVDQGQLGLLTEDRFYNIYEYPQYDWSFRLGVSWILLD